MKAKHIFDIDGTLTNPREKIDKNFRDFFLDICKKHEVFLSTGNKRENAVFQLGEQIVNSAQALFTCGGNECWVGDLLVYRREWNPPKDLVLYLEKIVDETWFEHATGEHLEFRPGMIKFSILGKNYSKSQRNKYIEWDFRKNERKKIVDELTQRFKVGAFIAGETSIDIYEKGYGKAQIWNQIKTSKDDYTIYYGDQIFQGGNDWDIAQMCDSYYSVTDWKDTFEILS